MLRPAARPGDPVSDTLDFNGLRAQESTAYGHKSRPAAIRPTPPPALYRSVCAATQTGPERRRGILRDTPRFRGRTRRMRPAPAHSRTPSRPHSAPRAPTPSARCSGPARIRAASPGGRKRAAGPALVGRSARPHQVSPPAGRERGKLGAAVCRPPGPRRRPPSMPDCAAATAAAADSLHPHGGRRGARQSRGAGPAPTPADIFNAAGLVRREHPPFVIDRLPAPQPGPQARQALLRRQGWRAPLPLCGVDTPGGPEERNPGLSTPSSVRTERGGRAWALSTSARAFGGLRAVGSSSEGIAGGCFRRHPLSSSGARSSPASSGTIIGIIATLPQRRPTANIGFRIIP